VLFSSAAQADLDAIFEWIADRAGTRMASQFTDRIRSYCQGFVDFPQRGIRRDDLMSGLRVVGFRRRATIAFMVQDTQIVILRILYRGRDTSAALAEKD